MSTREDNLEASVVRIAARRGVLLVKLTTRNGIPDRLFVAPGARCEFAELKQKGEDPEPHQVVEIERLRRLGFIVPVVHSVEEARSFLDEWLGAHPCD